MVQSATQYYSPNEICDEAVGASNEIENSVNYQSSIDHFPVATNDGVMINTPVDQDKQAVANDQSKQTEYNVSTTLQGEEILKFYDFINKDIH